VPLNPTPYTPIPYTRPVYEPDTKTLRDLLMLASQAQQQRTLQRGQIDAEGRMNLGTLIANALGSFKQEREQKQLLAAKNAFEQHKIDQAERLDRDQMAQAKAEREAQQQWQRDQFRNAQADARTDTMNPGEAMTPEVYAAKIAGTASEDRFRRDPAMAARLQAYPMADTGGVPGYATPQTDQQPFDVMQGPSMSRDVAARPEQFVRKPLFSETMSVEAAQRAQAAAQASAADRLADNARADAAARATEAYRSSQNDLRRQGLANSARAANSAAISVIQGPDGPILVDDRTGQSRPVLGPDGKPIPKYASTDTMAKYRTVFDRAIMNSSPSKRGPLVALGTRLALEGNEDQLKGVIKQAATEGENVDVKNQLMGRMTMMSSLKDVRAILDEMKQKGVPTNILRGTAENVARDLGKTTNPEYAKLANRLMDTLITYRRQATGVQFSVQESKQYEKMFPNYKNDLPVNLALIDGMERSVKGNDRTYWEYKLGKEGADLLGIEGPGKSYLSTDPNFGTPVAPRKP
jgi:hypothetical protein